MRILLALAVGYAIGAKGGGKDFEDLVRTIKAVRESEEFGDFVTVARSHVGSALHSVASIVDGSSESVDEGGQDLVEQVRHLFVRD